MGAPNSNTSDFKRAVRIILENKLQELYDLGRYKELKNIPLSAITIRGNSTICLFKVPIYQHSRHHHYPKDHLYGLYTFLNWFEEVARDEDVFIEPLIKNGICKKTDK